MTPELDIANAIAAALALAVGTDIKMGPARSPTPGIDEPANIWVAPYGGPAPDPLLNAGVEGSYYRSSVQVLVRGDADDYEDTLATARAVRDVLHTKQPAGYVAWFVKSSEPLYIGPNEAGQHQFTINVSAEWKAAA